MAKSIGRLTALKVRQIKKPGLHADGGGLFLQVSRTGSKSWIYRYKVDGKQKHMGLGPVHTIGLAEAREMARLCRVMRLAGEDPLSKRRAERADRRRGVTFDEAAAAYIRSHSAGWRDGGRSARQWTSSIADYCSPVFGDLPVSDIDTPLVVKVIEPLWSSKPETGRRLRGRIEAVLDWAKTRGYRQGENPARWRGHLQNLLPLRGKVAAVEHHPALHYRELGAFMAALRKDESIGAAALEFAILTAARTSEVLQAKWSEIDLGERLWTVPATRIKAAREHRVPLSDRAIEILERMSRLPHGEFVFPGGRAPGRPAGHNVMLRTLERLGRSDLTTHGFRSTFRDWCAERTNFPAEAAEMALAHAVGDKVEAAYRRGDMFQIRRRLMAAWQDFADGIEPSTGQVVELAAAR